MVSQVGEGLEKNLDYDPAEGEQAGWSGKFDFVPPKMGTQGLDAGKVKSFRFFGSPRDGFKLSFLR